MLRLVTEFVEKPVFLLMCDQPNCGCFSSGKAETSQLSAIELPQQEMAFLKANQSQGWLLSMRAQYCPGHAKQLREKSNNVVVS